MKKSQERFRVNPSERDSKATQNDSKKESEREILRVTQKERDIDI